MLRSTLATGLSTGPCPTADIDHSQEETSRAILRVQLISGGLFFAAAIWGVVDAVRHYQRDVVMTGPAAPSPPAVQVGLTPFGLSAALSF